MEKKLFKDIRNYLDTTCGSIKILIEEQVRNNKIETNVGEDVAEDKFQKLRYSSKNFENIFSQPKNVRFIDF